MPICRKPASRVNHLALALVLKRMLAGAFTASDVVEASGLHKSTVYSMLRLLGREGVIELVDKLADRTGCKRIQQWEIVRSAQEFPHVRTPSEIARAPALVPRRTPVQPQVHVLPS